MEEGKDKLAFYQQLMLQMVDKDKYPFYYLIIQNGLSKQQMDEIFALCDELYIKLKEQRELGFVHFTPLLVEFVGMLPHILNVKETVLALKKQKMYEDLMDVLLNEIDKIDR